MAKQNLTDASTAQDNYSKTDDQNENSYTPGTDDGGLENSDQNINYDESATGEENNSSEEAGNTSSDAVNNTAQTDNTKLVTTDTVYVSPDDGTTDEAFPTQGVEYDFCVDVANAGTLPSGPFYVRFTLSGDQNPPWEQDFQQDAGLDAGSNVKAVVHFGSFPNEFKSYFLEACIYSASAPATPINCGGTFEFSVNTESADSAASSDSSDNSGSPDTSGSDDTSGSADVSDPSSPENSDPSVF